MKTIGLLGGMSWHSTMPYYAAINQAVNDALGGSHSAKIVLYSMDFAPMEQNMMNGDWGKNADILAEAAKKLKTAGADFGVICTNTMHKVAPEVEAAAGLPLLHIADAVADALLGGNPQGKTYQRVGLLGTRFTMQQEFYRQKLKARGIEALVPPPQRQEEINEIIFTKLIHGEVDTPSRFLFQNSIEHLAEEGAEAVILGCTELAMLVQPEDLFPLPLFDSTEIHAAAAAKRALEG